MNTLPLNSPAPLLDVRQLQVAFQTRRGLLPITRDVSFTVMPGERIALVGESGTGRKGTAMWRAHGAMCDALEEVYVNRVLLDGINSGEGLITALEWRQRTYPQEPTVGLLFEEEFATVLASRSRDGSSSWPRNNWR